MKIRSHGKKYITLLGFDNVEYPLPMVLARLTLAYHELREIEDGGERLCEAAKISSASLLGLEFENTAFGGKPNDRILWIRDCEGDRLMVNLLFGQFRAEHPVDGLLVFDLTEATNKREFPPTAENISVKDISNAFDIPAFMVGMEIELD